MTGARFVIHSEPLPTVPGFLLVGGREDSEPIETFRIGPVLGVDWSWGWVRHMIDRQFESMEILL